jgi:hypothetical protein
MREIFRHRFAYIFLIIGVFIMIGLYLAAWPDHTWQRIIAVSFSLFYIFWGIIAHVKSSHLTRNIVLEYVGISILGGAVLLLLTI